MTHHLKSDSFNIVVFPERIQGTWLHTMQDNDRKIDAVIKELHYFGNLLTRKYKLLKTAYRCFYWGIVLSVASYLIILLLTNGGTDHY